MSQIITCWSKYAGEKFPVLQKGVSSVLSQNHRIIEGKFKGLLVQAPCHQQGHLQLDQVAQSPVQPGLECSQGWCINHLSGQPGPVSHHPLFKEFLPYI